MAKYGDYSNLSRPPLRRHTPPATDTHQSGAVPDRQGTQLPPVAQPRQSSLGQRGDRPTDSQGDSQTPLPPDLRSSGGQPRYPAQPSYRAQGREQVQPPAAANPFNPQRRQSPSAWSNAANQTQPTPPAPRSAIVMPPQPPPRPTTPRPTPSNLSGGGEPSSYRAGAPTARGAMPTGTANAPRPRPTSGHYAESAGRGIAANAQPLPPGVRAQPSSGAARSVAHRLGVNRPGANRPGANRPGANRSTANQSGRLGGSDRSAANRVTPLHRGQDSSPSFNLQGTPSGSRPRSRKTPKTPPMPVLYGIRILILGIGVAAIAGTLLSALTPTNISQADPTAAPSQTSGEATLVSAVRGQSRGVTVGSMPLKTQLTRLETELEQLSTLTPGLNQSTFVVDLDSGSYADVAGAEAVAAASTIKVPVLVAFLQAVDAGVVSLDQALVLQEHQIAGGSGNLQAEPVGSRYTALEVASRMIVNSDNTATNMMIDLLGGAEQLNQQFQSWGLAATVIRNPLPDLEGTNTTSARDLALLMALVDRGGLLSLRSHARMESIMQRTRNRSLIPAGIGQGAVIANKTGDIATSLGDVALVDTPNGHRYVIATLIQRPTNDGRASELIRRIAEHVNKEVDQPMAPIGAGAVKAISSPDVDSGSSTTPGTAPEASPTNPTGGYNDSPYPGSGPAQGSEPGSSFTSPSPYPSSPSNDDVDSQVPQG